jgi:hypothetical protein
MGILQQVNSVLVLNKLTGIDMDDLRACSITGRDFT